MSERTEKQLLEFGKWWEWNTKGTDDGGGTVWKLPEDINKRTELIAKGMDSLAHIYISLAEDIKILEGRGMIAKNFDRIITPDNVLGRNNGR